MGNLRLGLLTLLLLLFSTAASANEWEGVDHEGLGISQEEFQMVKEKGMSKTRLLQLLEYGISPSEYFSEPWKKLGVTEGYWLKEKKAGMADDDIDRSYRKQSSHNLDPVISFFLPGYYQYRTKRPKLGAALSAAFVGGLALTFLHQAEDGGVIPFYPIIAIGSMLFSAGDAYLGTRYQDNQDAQRFSFGIGLAPGGPGPIAALPGLAAGASLRF